MIPDPATAPRRADLPFLRRRSRPRAAATPRAATPSAATPSAAAPAASSASSASSGAIDYTRHRSARPSTPTVVSSGALDLGEPTGRRAVDYTHHGSASTPPSGGAPNSLDLSAADAPARPIDVSRPARGSGSLDLSDPPAAAPAPPRAAQAANARVRRDRRIEGRAQQILDVRTPTVTLTRVQSGVGHIEIEAVCSAEVGDLQLGAVYQLRSGGTSTLQHGADGHRFGPPSSRRPVLLATREEYQRIGVDLRQVGDIERIGIFAFSESRADLAWGGTLVITTFGGARVEIPLEKLYPGRIAMLASIYNLDGELVIRAELETVAGDVRETARAYGYDRITWRDERSPVD